MNDQLDRQVLVQQVIVAMMMTGVVAFGAIVLLILPGRTTSPEMANLLLPVLGVLAVGELVAYGVIRGVVLGNVRRQIEQGPSAPGNEGKALVAGQTLTLIRSAMAESVGLFGVVIVLISGNRLALVGPALALVIMALGFPTRNKLADLVSNLTGRNPYMS